MLKKGEIGETYNVGSGIEKDVETIADLILDALGMDAGHKTYVDDRPGHDRRYLLDSSKIRTQLGWEPQVDFAESFRDTVHWYRDNEAWWHPLAKENPSPRRRLVGLNHKRGSMSTDSFAEIVGETDDEIYQIRTRAPGPSGKLPLTIEEVVEAPSGHIFGYSQNAGMGWKPRRTGSGRVPHRQYAGRDPRPGRDGQSRWATTLAIGKLVC